MQLLHELKIFFQKGKKKSPAKAELKLQIFTNKAMSEKVGVFASGSARNPTSLAFVICFNSIWAFPLPLSFSVCFSFGFFSSVLLGVCLYWRGEAEPLVYIQAHA